VERWIARFCLLAALALAFAPRLALASQWGTGYGDPPGFCSAQSRLPSTYLSLPPTNDPTVANNPEQDTFFGYHPYPGYDDWYGYWYGDFRGRPGDASGWRLIRRVGYPQHWHWNFADWGWAVHGHVKQYIAYYNWTFGGQCGMSWYGSPWPAPYMADVDGYPVLDIYVDAVPPDDPKPRITSVSPGSISFSWDPVADRGDGAGADYFAVGLDHYTSWLTVNGGLAGGRRDSLAPLTLTAAATPADAVCVFVIAVDKLGNASASQSRCGQPSGSPPMPPPPGPAGIGANPAAPGLVGVPTWFWLEPAPLPVTTFETAGGIDYKVVAQPETVDWDFGDGGTLRNAGFGVPYPAESAIQHRYGVQSEAGYRVAADTRYSVSWWWRSGSTWLGPYPLGSQTVSARDLSYAVRQAQPELEMAA
jgi:hypothetical protein